MNIFVAVKVLSMMHSSKLYAVRVGKKPKNVGEYQIILRLFIHHFNAQPFWQST